LSFRPEGEIFYTKIYKISHPESLRDPSSEGMPSAEMTYLSSATNSTGRQASLDLTFFNIFTQPLWGCLYIKPD
jgi:hypothetical protein